MPRLPPYRLLYNNDCTNVGGCISPFRAHGEEFSDERLAASIEEAAAGGADCVTLAAGLGWIPWWKSSVDPDHYQAWMARTGHEPEQYGRYMLGGGDVIATHLATCRRLGIGCFVSLRLNDVHLQEHVGDGSPLSTWVCRFYERNTALLLDPDHQRIAGYYQKRGLDWTHAAVRDYKLSLAREMVAYDVDGIELDFLRDDHLFADSTPLESRARLIAEFIAGVRAALDAGRPGRWLSARIPLDAGCHAASGIDVSRMVVNGLDICNLSGWYDAVQRTDGLREIQRRVPGIATFIELTHSSAYHPFFLANNAYGTTGNPRMSDTQLASTARLALEAGAHGISLFNFVYYRHIQGNDLHQGIRCEPPLHLLRRLTDASWLARQPGHYWVGSTRYFTQLPRMVRPGSPEAFQLELAEHPRAYQARLRIHSRQPLPRSASGSALAVRLNGAALDATAADYRILGNPYDELISPAGHRCAFAVPIQLLRVGRNELEIGAAAGGEVEVVFIELGVDTTMAPATSAAATPAPRSGRALAATSKCAASAPG